MCDTHPITSFFLFLFIFTTAANKFLFFNAKLNPNYLYLHLILWNVCVTYSSLSLPVTPITSHLLTRLSDFSLEINRTEICSLPCYGDTDKRLCSESERKRTGASLSLTKRLRPEAPFQIYEK